MTKFMFRIGNRILVDAKTLEPTIKETNVPFILRVGKRRIAKVTAWDDSTKFREWALSTGYKGNFSIDQI